MGEWKELLASEFCQEVTDGTHDSPKPVRNGKYLLTSKHLQEYQLDFTSAYQISEEDYVKATARSKVDQHDVLFSMIGTIGTTHRVTILNVDFAVKNMGIFKIGGDETKSKWLYYWLKTRKAKEHINSCLSGTTQGYMTLKALRNFPIQIPSNEEMGKIVSILSELDDKIAVNRRICENLEAQAQALFKHWFIDFAPFKDGKFIETELGMIPEGWRVGTYSDIIQQTISGDWGKEKLEGNYSHKVACIRGCDFQDVKMGLRGKTPERYILEKNFISKHFEDKDVLVEISGGTATVSTGRICPISQLLIDKYDGDIVCTNFCRLVRPNKGYSSYLYYSWKHKYDRKVMFGYENGTSGIKNFSIKDFITREPLVLPDLSALAKFEEIIEHIHTQIQNYGSESAKLTSIRDTLLPKLMSGQIKL